MSQWEGKSKGTPLGYRIFVYLIRKTGVVNTYALLRFVVVYYFLFSWKTSKHILVFYRKKLGFNNTLSLRNLYNNYYKLGQTLLDKVALLSGNDPGFSFIFDGEHHLHQMTAQGKGGLLLSGHLGNWEVAGHLLKRLNTTVHIVMYDGENEGIKQTLSEVNQQRSFRIIYVRKDLSHIYEISNALSKNELVCIHADRYLPGNKTVTAPFFGEPASFPEGPFLLALKLKAPVTMVFAFKKNKKVYHFYSSPIMHFNQSMGHTVETVASQYASYLETMTRLYPEQWFNYYDFWKKSEPK